MKDEIYRKLHREFDRIANLLMAADSEEFPMVLIMGAGNEEEDFILGGNVNPNERLDYIRHFLESAMKEGVGKEEMIKEHSGVN